MWAYALIATGLINWSYEREQSGVAINSAILVIPGLVLFATTFNKTLAAKLNSKVAMYFWGAVGVMALIFTFVK
jgi:Mg2+/Co2+ transporter CorB